MDIKIIIGGQAGQGVLKASHILSKAFIRAGYYVFNYRDYQSRIRGGHNYNALQVSDKQVFSHDEENIDYLLALDKKTIDIHSKKLANNGLIIGDKNFSTNSHQKLDVDVSHFLKKANLSPISANLVLISVLWKVLGLPKEILKEIISKEISEKSSILVDYVFDELKLPIEEIREVKNRLTRKYYLTGSEGVAYGAIAAGLDMYIAYPMTPASPVLHILAKLKDKYGFLVYHPDNEIGVINMAVGASYAGARVMVGTSGGGFALMNEAFSLSGMSEIPIVVYLAQRYAPATGMPTYTMQGDLKFALNAGHGEFPRIVIAPGDPMEAFRRTIEAFYLSERYRVPAILLSDTFLAESAMTFDNIPSIKIRTKKSFDKSDEEIFPLYKITETGVSPRSIPYISEIVKANSYEHDEYGFTTEDPEIGKAMNEKRWRKLKFIEDEIKRLDPFTLYGSGNKLLIGWGSTKMPVLEALKYLKDWVYLHISYISPFPKEIKQIIEEYETIVLIENNVTGLLGQVIREQTGIKIENKILKYDGRPFTPSYLIPRIKAFE